MEVETDLFSCELDSVQLTAYISTPEGVNGVAGHSFDGGSDPETMFDIVIENTVATASSSAAPPNKDPAKCSVGKTVDEASKSSELQRHTLDGNTEDELKYKSWPRVRAKIVGLSFVFVIVLCLLLLPIVIFYIPVNTNTSKATSNSTISGFTCTPYTSSICQEELFTLKRCFLGSNSNNSDYPAVVSESRSEVANQALFYVDLIATAECASKVKPFLCLYFFGLCDEATGTSFQQSASECRNIRDNICMQEWNTATAFGLSLPNCDVEFPAEGTSCVENGIDTETSSSASGSGELLIPDVLPTAPIALQDQPVVCSNITCREGFYCDDGHDICNPICGTWRQYSRSVNVGIDFLLLGSTCIGILGGVGVLIVAGLRWKKVFVFPSILVVYQSITLLVLGFFVIVTYVDNSTLYCTSQNLYISLSQPTPFCIIAGAVLYYSLFQLTTFWLCHILTLFWGLKFPFQARAFQRAHQMKYIHITCVFIGLLVPSTPVVATMVQFSYGRSSAEAVKGGLGFGIVRFPPLLCVGRHADTTFYSLILPLSIILLIGITFLFFVFWIIHKQHGLFRARQSRNSLKISTAERKILIVFVYNIVLSVLALLTFSQATHDSHPFISELLNYFDCERKGVDPDNLCDRSGAVHDRFIINIVLELISYILLGLYSTVNFIFVIDFQELKKLFQRKFSASIQTN